MFKDNVRVYGTKQSHKITSLSETIEEYDKICDAAFLLLIAEPRTNKPIDVGIWRIQEARKLAERYLTWVNSIELNQEEWDELHSYVEKHLSQELLAVRRMANTMT